MRIRWCVSSWTMIASSNAKCSNQCLKNKCLKVRKQCQPATWAMKKKANGTLRARLDARGFEQVDGVHYNEDDKAAPVVNDITICIVMTLMVMARWYGHLLDVRGAFLQGTFEPGEQIHMEIPQGFEKCCPKNVVLLLLRTICGLKNSAMAFWRKMLSAFYKMDCKRSKADPCLCFKWTAGFGLTIWLSHACG